MDDLPAILANPDHLKQVFLNLVLNSIDALPDGGNLHISTSLDQIQGHADQKPRPAVCITFRDDGLGMTTETMTHLFEPFFTTKSTGSGLGLSVSYGIIEAHEGKISVTSELGEGSTFVIWLPLEAATVDRVSTSW
jgi:signal transduction histidine kinase